MNKFFNTICRLCVLTTLLVSCKKDALNVQQPVGLGGDATVATAIDKWILDSLTTPYNIEVKYKWDPANASLYRTVTPTDESKILPLLRILKRLWITPYNEASGSDLMMKKYAPKQLILLGSVEYDENGNGLAGSVVEGSGVINFLDVNQHFFPDPVKSTTEMILTVHHEFGHILHQNVRYPQDFIGTSQKLGLANYTSTWFNLPDGDYALGQGYVTKYALNIPDDDFVETIAYMLVDGKSKWEEKKASTNATARQALQQKEDYVVAYYRQAWNIDFYMLQTRVQAGLKALYPPPAVLDVFGYGKEYSTASVNPANTAMLPQSAAFTTLFNSAKTALASVVSGGSSGRVLDSFDVYQYSPASVLLECYFHAPASPSTQQAAVYLYTYAQDANNVFTFTLAGNDPNGATFATALSPLLNYFSNNKFRLTWYADPSTTLYPRIQFIPQSTPGAYFIARLLP